MEGYTKPTKRDFNPDLYILHVGTNLSLDDTSEAISSRIRDTANSLMAEKRNKIIVSNIIPRGDKCK